MGAVTVTSAPRSADDTATRNHSYRSPSAGSRRAITRDGNHAAAAASASATPTTTSTVNGWMRKGTDDTTNTVPAIRSAHGDLVKADHRADSPHSLPLGPNGAKIST